MQDFRIPTGLPEAPLIPVEKSSSALAATKTSWSAHALWFESEESFLAAPVGLSQADLLAERPFSPEQAGLSSVGKVQPNLGQGISRSRIVATDNGDDRGYVVRNMQCLANSLVHKYRGHPGSKVPQELDSSPSATRLHYGKKAGLSLSSETKPEIDLKTPISVDISSLLINTNECVNLIEDKRLFETPKSAIPLGLTSSLYPQIIGESKSKSAEISMPLSYSDPAIPANAELRQQLSVVNRLHVEARNEANNSETPTGRRTDDASVSGPDHEEQRLKLRDVLRAAPNESKPASVSQTKGGALALISQGMDDPSAVAAVAKEHSRANTYISAQSIPSTQSTLNPHQSAHPPPSDISRVTMTDGLNRIKSPSTIDRHERVSVKAELSVDRGLVSIVDGNFSKDQEHRSNATSSPQALRSPQTNLLFDPFRQMDHSRTPATVRVSPSLRTLDASVDSSIQGVSGIQVERVSGGINVSVQTVSSASTAILAREAQPIHGFLSDNNVFLSQLVIDHGTLGGGKHSPQTAKDQNTGGSRNSRHNQPIESTPVLSESESYGLVNLHA